MGVIPGTIETDQQPPMTIPLRHFVVGLGFLFVGALVGIGISFDAIPGLVTLAHLHLLLAGWICLTIMGAMTQFVPVWAGVRLHSQKLASGQLPLVAVGLLGFAAGLICNSLAWLVPFGGLMLAGFWVFVYNIARTMAPLAAYDVTERHFVLSLGFFAVLTVSGFLLAIDLTRPVFGTLPVTRTNVVALHATIAVFGAVLTVVYGALYQLATMFTQTELHGVDEYLRPIEEVGHPLGVGLLAVGRFAAAELIAQVGAVLVLGAALAFATILVRKLFEMTVKWTPMHTRYAVAVLGLIAWAIGTVPAWLRNPTAPEHLLGAPGAVHLFVLGSIGFVVLGTLYHIIPFIVWVHRYSDRLGLEAVPMVDELYDDRLAVLDVVLLVTGTTLLVLSELFVVSVFMQRLGGGLVFLGIVVFTANMLLVLRNHSPQSIGRILLGSLGPGGRYGSVADATSRE